MQSPMNHREQCESRWVSEAVFFDREAAVEASRVWRTPPSELRRYRGPRYRKRFSKEYRFGLLGNLSGKKVLDVGCGTGENAALFALLGAEVWGVDISANSIEVARRRVRLDGTAPRTTFVCGPIEQVDLDPDGFDVVWCSAFLHHVIDELRPILTRMVTWAKPRGLMVVSEPAVSSEALRVARSLFPVQTSGTPGERPLEVHELALIADHLLEPVIRPYLLLGRAVPFFLDDAKGYERAPRSRRILADLLYGLDLALLSLPFARRLAGSVVMCGSPNKAKLVKSAA